MTVREAVALSGGYDVLRVRMENPILLAADLKGEYQSLWTEFAKQLAHALRLEAELAGKDTFDKKFLTEAPLPPLKAAEKGCWSVPGLPRLVGRCCSHPPWRCRRPGS